MPKQLKTTRKGFTIIEVVLVLAIAGLIFLMVFTALPALQRSQRDTARRDDLARFLTQITNYQTNNRGKLPGTGATDASAALSAYAKFIINYLWANGDSFIDPDGYPYYLGGICVKFGDSTSKLGGQNCEVGGITSSVPSQGSDAVARQAIPTITTPSLTPVAADTVPATTTTTTTTPTTNCASDLDNWDGSTVPCATALVNTSASTTDFDHAIFIYQNAKCDGESVIKGSGARNLAIQFKFEGGGVYCGTV